ncbi:hypothetical protein ACLKMY_24340 [Paraburkholderia mimosarum]|uniref:hypothetical protein n=1 Tax=Paraburkholderia mimosarum TaxID=312026 RepID=UPI0039C0E7E2
MDEVTQQTAALVEQAAAAAGSMQDQARRLVDEHFETTLQSISSSNPLRAGCRSAQRRQPRSLSGPVSNTCST